MKRPTISATILIALTALFITLVLNQPFWHALAQRLDLATVEGFSFALTFASVMTGLLMLLFLLLGQRLLLKPLLIVTLFVSALISYFNGIGVVIDDEMLRNVLETARDHNSNEAAELASASMIRFLLLYAVLPSAAILFLRVRHAPTLLRGVGLRLLWAGGVIVVVAALVMLNFKYVTYFSRENRDLRLTLNPFFPLTSAVKLYKREHAASDRQFTVLGRDARQRPHGKKRVGIMVVGETARADRFSLDGYRRKTNPLLERESVASFTNAWSCGTSTAYSVPCMFSFLDRRHYSPARASRQSNVLDVLRGAGVNVVWRDNNSSCKGVCERVASENFHHDFDPASPYYHKGEYTDEILLENLEALIEKTPDDALIVLHTMGSHGPAYYKRYPEAFERFTPACRSNSPHECPDDEVDNAYSNTIVYTDYVLDRIIRFLREHEDRYDSFMLYASDHGESLGENGVYLHGLPYLIAPEAQKHIPLIAWLSPELERKIRLSPKTLADCTDEPVSHDNLAHTLLGLFDVSTRLYRPELDLFAGVCRQHG